MNIIHINSFGWWLIIFLNFVGYFILRFAMISNGALKEVDKALGTILITLSFILMFVFFGFFSTVALLVILWVIATPIVMVIIGKLEKKLFPYREEIRKNWARKLNVTENEVDRVNQMDEGEFLKEMSKRYKWLDESNWAEQDEIEKIKSNKNIPDVVKQEFIKRAKK